MSKLPMSGEELRANSFQRMLRTSQMLTAFNKKKNVDSGTTEHTEDDEIARSEEPDRIRKT